MRKVLLGLALLAPSIGDAQTPQRGQGGYDTGSVVPCIGLDGVTPARCLMPGMIPYDANGNPIGTATNPLVTSGAGGSGGNTTDAQGSGTLNAATANATYVIPLSGGRSALGLRISGLTASGATLTAERSNDGGTTWTNANTTESSTTASLSATITTDGQARIGVAGATNIRLRVSTAGTGTVSIAYNATAAAGPVFLIGNLPSYTTPNGQIIGGIDNRYIAGTLVSTNTGAADAGTQRTVTASTSPEVLNQTNGNQQVQGNIADGATDAGNSIKFGCLFYTANVTAATTNGRYPCSTDAYENIRIAVVSSGVVVPNDNLTGIAGTYGRANNTAVQVAGSTLTYMWNGTAGTYVRGDTAGTAVQQGLGTTTFGGAASTTTYASTGVTLKATTGNVGFVNVVNSTAAGFLLLANLTAVPASGTAVTAAQNLYCMPVAASQGFDKTFQVPLNFTAGITAMLSTSCTTYTPVATAPVQITVQFK